MKPDLLVLRITYVRTLHSPLNNFTSGFKLSCWPLFKYTEDPPSVKITDRTQFITCVLSGKESNYNPDHSACLKTPSIYFCVTKSGQVTYEKSFVVASTDFGIKITTVC